MAQEQAKQLLQQGIAAARSGRPDVAREFLQQAVRLDPQNEMIWLWMTSVARDDKERLFCLKQLLTINPQNEFALKGMRALGIEPAEKTAEAAAPAAKVPVLSDEKYNRIQQSIDDFLRRYSPLPPASLDIQWTHKEKRRYGEAAAQRLKQATYASAALVFLGIIAVIAVIVIAVLPDENKGTEAAARSTRVPTSTPTPTMTPTPGGFTPTPFSQQMAVAPTAVREGPGEPGNEYGTPGPTEVYPAPHPNVANQIRGAIGYYSVGFYGDAIGTLDAVNANSDRDCYPSIIYFEAMSYAAEKDYDQAASLLETAYNEQPPANSFSKCQNDPLVLAGLAEVNFRRGNIEEALEQSTQAISGDRNLVQAYVTKGQAELALGSTQIAWNTVVGDALNQWPRDTNLLLLAAEIELAAGNVDEAFNYIGTALYVDPTLRPALRFQARLYLLQAQQMAAPDDQRVQMELYGLVVRSAQTLLHYHAGDPAGYLYLAKGRIGEGNLDEAETALNRIIEVENDIPDEAAIVEDAYRTRAALYLSEGRLDQAEADFTIVSEKNRSQDQNVLVTLFEIALAKRDYRSAAGVLEQLLGMAPDNSLYRLRQVQMIVETCALEDSGIECDYGDALDTLTDDFIIQISDPMQQAEAYSYRAQARFQQTMARRSLPPEERQTELEQALADFDAALSLEDRAIDHYFRGRILQELDQRPDALKEYQWVSYWNDLYNYPFVEDDFENRVQDLEANLRDERDMATSTAAASITPSAIPTQQPTALPTQTPRPTETLRPTETPRPTSTLLPTETPVPAATLTPPQLP